MVEQPTFGHGGSLGDIIWHIPSMIDLARRQGFAKFHLRLKLNMPRTGGEQHPCGRVNLNQLMADSLIPLLKLQPYIDTVDYWKGESIIDMDAFRRKGLDLGQGDIGYWPCVAFLCTPDLSRPWLTVGGTVEPSGELLVGRSGRYRNTSLNYHVLRGRGYHFVGLEEENDTGLPWLPTPSILELARAIASCRLFVGNQSLAFALASALDKERVLEWSPKCPNVQPHTQRCMAVWSQEQFVAATTSR